MAHDSASESDMFRIVSRSENSCARVAELLLPDREPIATPSFIPISSRGTIPHITQDVYKGSTISKGLYIGLEDFIETLPRREPPIYSFPLKSDRTSRLRDFIALPDPSVLLVGPRRIPPVPCPTNNTATSIATYTSVGFNQLSVAEYCNATSKLSPDLVVGLGDIPPFDSTADKILTQNVDAIENSEEKPRYSRKRTRAMIDRTSRWVKEQVEMIRKDDNSRTRFIAPLLPLSVEAQKGYLQILQEIDEQDEKTISGLAIYDADLSTDLPSDLHRLPKLGMTEPNTPQRILHEISKGIDIFTIPFIGSCTDAGTALDFQFPVADIDNDDNVMNKNKPLGIDMWSEKHATDVSSLSHGCKCYACTDHHRAYVRHLLSAKEMLGWTLLQIHNLFIVEKFFDGVRAAIKIGSFEKEKVRFEEYYESIMPLGTGQGPRVRGYQYKSDGPGEQKRNPAPFRPLVDEKAEKLAETAESNPIKGAQDMIGEEMS